MPSIDSSATDERSRRLLAGSLAQQHGRGGIALVARITGLSPHTIRRGRRELEQPPPTRRGRIRRRRPDPSRLKKKSRDRDSLGGAAGRRHGGRSDHRVEVDPPLAPQPEQGLAPARDQTGCQHDRATAAGSGFRLADQPQTPGGDPRSPRDRQFRYLVRMRRLYLTRGLPVISVDTKKKGLMSGNWWRLRRGGHAGPPHCPKFRHLPVGPASVPAGAHQKADMSRPTRKC